MARLVLALIYLCVSFIISLSLYLVDNEVWTSNLFVNMGCNILTYDYILYKYMYMRRRIGVELELEEEEEEDIVKW